MDMDKVLPATKRCLTCGTALVHTMSGRGVKGPRKYCSEQCAPRCSVNGCDGASRKKGWCAAHYSQWRRIGEVKPFGRKWADKGTPCVVCGAAVPENSGRRKHCSESCQAADSRHQQKRPEAFTCRMCGDEVTLKSRDHRGRLQRTDTQWCRKCRRDSPDALRFHKYGVTPEQYAEALNRGCAICGTRDVQLHVDHDHACCGPRSRTCGNCVRGLICGPCNRGIGIFRENTDVMLSAITYLKNSTEKSGGTVT